MEYGHPFKKLVVKGWKAVTGRGHVLREDLFVISMGEPRESLNVDGKDRVWRKWLGI